MLHRISKRPKLIELFNAYGLVNVEPSVLATEQRARGAELF